ncbi:hypothetical protein [uncultured Clostridium sp.]|uniref:hypothetical protein n=2 Tax=uncultured Clostridium sp. TaxID=59620 RepID=UPI002634A8BA|nr:hypothetical protein [uncultured Clostridium sp.]
MAVAVKKVTKIINVVDATSQKNAANQNDLLSNNRYEKGWKIDKILKENCKLKLCLKIIKLIEIFYKIY